MNRASSKFLTILRFYESLKMKDFSSDQKRNNHDQIYISKTTLFHLYLYNFEKRLAAPNVIFPSYKNY